MLALYTQFFPESCEKISQAYYSDGIQTHDPCNSRAVSYQLDYRDCPVARGSSNPMFWQWVPQWYNRCGNLTFIIHSCGTRCQNKGFKKYKNKKIKCIISIHKPVGCTFCMLCAAAVVNDNQCLVFNLPALCNRMSGNYQTLFCGLKFFCMSSVVQKRWQPAILPATRSFAALG